MSVTWMYLVCVSVMLGSTYGNTGTDVRTSCPVQCDAVQELTLIRQLLNQESLLRINTNNEIQELKKAVKHLSHNSYQLNTSIATKIESLERTTNNRLTDVTTSVQRAESAIQTLETTTDSRLKSVKSSVQRARSSITSMQNIQRATKQDLTTLETSVTAIRNDNTAARGDLTKLERTLTSMNQTYQARGSPVAFTASHSSDITSSIGKIVFDEVITNEGGAYSSTTGIFTCPADGVYVFTWTIRTIHGKHCYAKLYINGSSRPLEAVADLRSVSPYAYSQGAMSGTFRLSAGDRVWLKTGGCTHFSESPYNAFSGWKL